MLKQLKLLKISQMILIFLFVSACGHLKGYQTKTKNKMTKAYWLKTSMNAGFFYDDDRIFLMDHRPFESIKDAKTIDGFTIYPPSPNHILKAGTLVKIIDISWPQKNSLKKPLFGPKNNIIIYFKVATERGLVNVFKDKNYAMIMPTNIKDQEDIQEYLNQFLSKEDPNQWILEQSRAIKNAIWLKKAILGMDKKQLIASLGPCDFILQKNQYNHELWHYEKMLVELKDGIAIKIKNF